MYMCYCMYAVQIFFFFFWFTGREYIFIYVKVIYNHLVLKGSCEKCWHPLQSVWCWEKCVTVFVCLFVCLFGGGGCTHSQFHACTYILDVQGVISGRDGNSVSVTLPSQILVPGHTGDKILCVITWFVGSRFGTWFLKALHPWYCCFIDHPRICIALAWRFLCKYEEAGLPVGINEQMMVSMCFFTFFSENVTWDTIGYHSVIYLEVICDLLQDMITCKHIYTHKYWQLKRS